MHPCVHAHQLSGEHLGRTVEFRSIDDELVIGTLEDVSHSTATADAVQVSVVGGPTITTYVARSAYVRFLA